MFDHHHFHVGPRSVDITARITEQRAPTDESVRLLKEMEAAAQEKVLESVRLEGNGFNAVVHFHRHLADMDVSLRCIYEWRGERREVVYRTSEDMNTSTPKGKAELMLGLRDKLATDIANAVLGKTFAAVKW